MPLEVISTKLSLKPELSIKLTDDFRDTFIWPADKKGGHGPGNGPVVFAQHSVRPNKGFKSISIVTAGIAPQIGQWLDSRNIDYESSPKDLLEDFTEKFMKHAKDEQEARKMALKHIEECNQTLMNNERLQP